MTRKFLLKFRKRDKESVFFQEVYHGKEAKDLRRIKVEAKNVPDLEDKKSNFYAVSDNFCEQLVSFLNVSKDLLMLDYVLRDGIPISKIQGAIDGKSKRIKKYPKAEVFECDEEAWPQIVMAFRDRRQRVALSRNLPGIILSGAIAQYDNMLQILLKEVIKIKPELALSFEKPLTLKDLQMFETMDDARDYVVEKYVENFTRDSHYEQIKTIEKLFNLPLTKDLPSLKKFLEVCQRRHCLAHSGGIATRSYVETLKQQGVSSDVKIGDQLVINQEYFEEALKVIFEIGFKLIQVLWRKFSPDDAKLADHEIINQPLHLIQIEEYELAEEILRFAKSYIHNWESEHNKLISHVNYANAIKLKGDYDKAVAVLEEVEWSARSPDFQICVAAVKDDVEMCLKLLEKYTESTNIDLTTIFSWPVFYKIREEKDFQAGCEKIFGKAISTSDVDESADTDSSDKEQNKKRFSIEFG